MFFDDDLPRKPATPEPRNLEPLSIAELEEHIAWLHAEAERARAEIARKKAAGAAAEGFFKKG
jgi:uncharacterized small protein (DUF1192 family)